VLPCSPYMTNRQGEPLYGPPLLLTLLMFEGWVEGSTKRASKTHLRYYSEFGIRRVGPRYPGIMSGTPQRINRTLRG
jgi:hypothetical protein